MIAPTRARVALRLVVHQPLQGRDCSIIPFRSSGSAVEAHESPCKKPHALRRVAFGNSEKRSKIEREPAHALLKSNSQVLVIECELTEKTSTETVKRIIARIVALFQPARKAANGFVDQSHRCASRLHDLPTSRCHCICRQFSCC